MRPVVAILYSGDDWRKRIPFSDPEQRAGYESFYDALRDAGYEPMRICIEWFRNGRFTKAWTYSDGRWRKLRRPARPDFILDKASLSLDNLPLKQAIAEEFMVINPWELEMIADDKLITNIAFAEIAAPTYLVRSQADVQRVVDEMKAEDIVLKPRFGHGGKGVRILPRAEARVADIDELTVVQPFVDTSAGIPGIHDGIHDFRIVYADDKQIAAYVRTPAPGTALCNISQGGGMFEVSVSDIPKSLQKPLEQIEKRFAVFPHKIYSVDFFYQNRRTPLLVEINSKPIITFPLQFQAFQDTLHRAYIDYIDAVLGE